MEGLIQQETLDELTNYKLVFRCGGGIHTDSAGRFFYSKSSSPQHSPQTEAFNTVEAFLKNSYARDFKKAYRYISLGDRQLKAERVYVREKGSFSGFPLAVTRKLAQFIELRPLETVREQNGQLRVKLEAKYPDANSLSAILLEWDEERLNALPTSDAARNLIHPRSNESRR